MPRDLDSTSRLEKNKKTNQPVFLYTIYDYDGEENNLYFAEYDQNVIYDGQTYTKFPIAHEYIGENTQGQIDTVRVTLSNVSRLIQAYFENYDFRGKKVSIKMVWADQLGDPDAYIEDIYYIDSYVAGQYNAEFVLTTKFDVLDLELPVRKYSRNYCAWKFKSGQCGYSGGETECNRTLQRCRQLGNQLRFGGFPSIPSRRIFVG